MRNLKFVPRSSFCCRRPTPLQIYLVMTRIFRLSLFLNRILRKFVHKRSTIRESFEIQRHDSTFGTSHTSTCWHRPALLIILERFFGNCLCRWRDLFLKIVSIYLNEKGLVHRFNSTRSWHIRFERLLLPAHMDIDLGSRSTTLSVS